MVEPEASVRKCLAQRLQVFVSGIGVAIETQVGGSGPLNLLCHARPRADHTHCEQGEPERESPHTHDGTGFGVENRSEVFPRGSHQVAPASGRLSGGRLARPSGRPEAGATKNGWEISYGTRCTSAAGGRDSSPPGTGPCSPAENAPPPQTPLASDMHP